MKVAEEIIVPNIPKSLFWEFENKEAIPVAPPTKFMRNCIIAINPTSPSEAEVSAVIHTNRKNINPKIEKIKEVMPRTE